MNSRSLFVLFLLIPILFGPVVQSASARKLQMLSAAAPLKAGSAVLIGLEVKNNETYIIENGRYVFNDSITVKENGTLIVRNAIVEFNLTSSFVLYTQDNATLVVSNATLSHVWGYFYMNIKGRTSMTVNASSFQGNAYIRLYDTAIGSIDSSQTYSITANNNATLTVSNVNTQYLYCYSLSITTVNHSVVYYLNVEDSSRVSTVECTISERITLEFQADSNLSVTLPRGKVDLWSLTGNGTVTKAYVNLTMVNTRVSTWTLYCYDTSSVEVRDSVLDTLNAYDNSSVTLRNCNISSAQVQEYGGLVLADSTVTSRLTLVFEGSDAGLALRTGRFISWSLHVNNTVTPSYPELTLRNSTVSGWNIYAYSSTISLAESDVEYFYIYDNSTVSILNSTVYATYGYGHSHVSFESATVDWLYGYDLSVCDTRDSTVRGLYAYSNSSVTADHVRTEYLGVYDYASALITDSFIAYGVEMSFVDDSKAVLDSLPTGHVAMWNLYENSTVTRAYVNLTIVNSMLRGWNGFNVYGSSDVSVLNSMVQYVYVYGLSQVTVADSFVDNAYIYDNSSLLITGSSINSVQIKLAGDTGISFSSLPSGWVDNWNLYDNATVTRAYVNCTLLQSWMGQWAFTAYESASLSFKYCKIDSIYAYDSSEILTNNCTLGSMAGYSKATVSLYKTVVQYNVYAYDESSFTITDSNLQSRLYIKFKGDSEVHDLSLPTGPVTHWSLNENATVKRAFFSLTISNTTIKAWGIYTYGSSTISLADSVIEYFSENEYSTVMMKNCTIETFYVYKLSQLQVSSVSSSRSVVTNFYTYGMSTATLTEVRVAIITAYADSTVNIVGSYYGVIRVSDRATILVNWFLDVHVVDHNVQDAPSAQVTATTQDSLLSYSATTDSDGRARLSLREKTIDARGSHPVGAYTVTATSSGFTADEQVEMTENKQVTVNLPGIVPESSVALLIPLLVLLSAYAFFLKKRHAFCSPKSVH